MDLPQQTFLVFQDVFKTSSRRVCKTSCNYVFKTSSGRLQDLLSTSSPRQMFAGFQQTFVFRRRLHQYEYVCLSLMSSEDVFKTSWLRQIYSSWP